MHRLINNNDIVIDNNKVFSYNELLNLAKKIIGYSDRKTKDILREKIKPQKIKFPFIDFIFLKEDEKEHYFPSGNISYIKAKSNEGDNFDNNRMKIQFFNNYDENNILIKKDANRDLKSNNFCNTSDNSINNSINIIINDRYSNSSDKIYPSSLESKDLLKLIENSINHILAVKPFYNRLNNNL